MCHKVILRPTALWIMVLSINTCTGPQAVLQTVTCSGLNHKKLLIEKRIQAGRKRSYKFCVFSVLPLEVFLMWKPVPWTFGLIGCKAMVTLTEMVAYVSILTMIAFTFERLVQSSLSLKAA
jgi:hypothetical protein